MLADLHGDLAAKEAERIVTEAALQQPLAASAGPRRSRAAVLSLPSPAASFVIGVGLPVDGSFTAHGRTG